MADRYWVGNGGNWSDNTNHWSASSGGAAGASLPTAADNVFFDAASFSASSTVTLDSGTPITLDFDCTGLDQAVTIDGSLGFINRGDAITLNSNLTMSFTGLWDISVDPITSGLAAINITRNSADLSGLTGGIKIGSVANSNFPSFSGRWDILDNFVALNSDLTIETGVSSTTSTSNTGTLYTNGFTVSVKKITVLSTTSGSTHGKTNIVLGTSTVNTASIVLQNGSSSVVPDVSGASSTINFTPVASPQSELKYMGAYTITWGTINLNAGTGSFQFNSDGTAFTLTTFTVQAGTTFSISSNAAFTISGTFTANGSAGNLITFDNKGTGTPAQGTISAAVASVSYVDVINSNAEGAAAPFDDSNGGVDSGNNTDWIFFKILARPMYFDK